MRKLDSQMPEIHEQVSNSELITSFADGVAFDKSTFWKALRGMHAWKKFLY